MGGLLCILLALKSAGSLGGTQEEGGPFSRIKYRRIWTNETRKTCQGASNEIGCCEFLAVAQTCIAISVLPKSSRTLIS